MRIKTAIFEAVIFDMDGLIFDTESIYSMSWKEAAVEQGYYISDDLYKSLLGLRTDEAYNKLISKFGNEFNSDLFHVRSNYYWYNYVKSGVPRKKGLNNVLDYLNNYKIPKAIATSSSREKSIFSLGEIAGQFDVIVCGEDIQRGKPHPDIFLSAARQLDVIPCRCIVLEDSPLGIYAAKRAGMIPIMVPDLIKPSGDTIQKAFCICNSLQDVVALFKLDHNKTFQVISGWG